MTKKLTFIYLLRQVNPKSPAKMSPKEKAIVDEHFEYLKKRLAERKLFLAGRCLDGEFGIVIFYAGSEKQAEDFMKSDPAIKKGLMTAELCSFRIALTERS